jgi:hypothetical protein
MSPRESLWTIHNHISRSHQAQGIGLFIPCKAISIGAILMECVFVILPWPAKKYVAHRQWNDVTLDCILIVSNIEWDVHTIWTLSSLLNHCTLYRFGCLLRWSFILSHNLVLARFWQLPPSIITLIEWPSIPYWVWKILHLWSSWTWDCVVKISWTISDGLVSCAQE